MKKHAANKALYFGSWENKDSGPFKIDVLLTFVMFLATIRSAPSECIILHFAFCSSIPGKPYKMPGITFYPLFPSKTGVYNAHARITVPHNRIPYFNCTGKEFNQSLTVQKSFQILANVSGQASIRAGRESICGA